MNTGRLLLLFGLAVSACAGEEKPRPDDASAQTAPAPARGRGRGAGPGSGTVDGHPHLACTFAGGALADAVRAGVEEALADEWAAEARYEAYAGKLGRPFPRLERAEARHANLLVALLEAHGHAIPSKEKESVPEAKVLAEACKASLEAERNNVALYDRLLASNPPDDVACVYGHLRSLSADRHIPSLERCGPGAP